MDNQNFSKTGPSARINWCKTHHWSWKHKIRYQWYLPSSELNYLPGTGYIWKTGAALCAAAFVPALSSQSSPCDAFLWACPLFGGTNCPTKILDPPAPKNLSCKSAVGTTQLLTLLHTDRCETVPKTSPTSPIPNGWSLWFPAVQIIW